MLVTTTHARISGAICAHAFRLMQEVEAYQVLQDRPGQVELRIVRAAAYQAAIAEAKLRDVFRRHLGDTAQIDFAYVDSVQKTAAGKARFVINNYLSRLSTNDLST